MPPHDGRRQLLLNLMTVAVVVAIPLAVGEVAMRVATRAPGTTAYRITLGDSINVRDSVLGWVTRPRAAFTVRSPEYEVAVRLDTLGMRTPRIGTNAACRTLVIGDSFVAGFAVYDEQLFWAELARRTGCEVFGAGVEGWSTDQELLFLRHLLPRIRPTTVILAFYQNDVWCNAQPVCENAGKPVFALERDSLRLSNIPVTHPPAATAAITTRRDTQASIAPLLQRQAPAARATPEDPVRRGPMSLRLRRWLNDHSRVYREARRALGREERQPSGSLMLTPLPHEFRVLHRPYDGDIAHAWRVTEALLMRFVREVRAADAHPIILHVPLRESVYPALWSAIAERQGFGVEWRPDTEEAELRRICVDHALQCVFPSAAMRAAASRGAPLYFRNDPHWTRQGHALVGRLLADVLPR